MTHITHANLRLAAIHLLDDGSTSTKSNTLSLMLFFAKRFVCGVGCSPRVHVGFLWVLQFPPTPQKPATLLPMSKARTLHLELAPGCKTCGSPLLLAPSS